jgi:MinD-like ATPase involved in chromosome partitioning or flagellar assembly
VSGALSVIVCAGGAAWEVPLLRGLQRKELGIRVVRRCVDHGDLLGTALRDRPRAVVLDRGLGWVDRDLVATLRRAGIEVLGIGGRPGGRDEIGIVGVAATVGAAELARILQGLGPATEPVATEAAAGAGRIVAVWGAAGAPGRTTVAVHLAIESARRGARTLLVDGDAWAASVAQLLELAESPSVAQAARLAARGWPTPLSECLQAGPDGLQVLAGLPRAELWPEVTPESWRAVLAAGAAEFEVVVVDVAAPVEEDEELVTDRLPFRRNLMTTGALDHADLALLVVAADPVGLRRGVVAHRQLTDRSSARAEDVTVVLNRMPRSARHAQDCSRAVESWVGTPPAALLSFEPTFTRVVWEGRPLHVVAPRSPWLRDLRVLLGQVGS